MNEAPGAGRLRRFVRYDGVMVDNPKGKAVKSGVGVIGAIATIISVWWFALRPRRKRDGQ
ncbi:MAG: hypothetical protein HKL86_05115 [Acidimicrobiaceae bacterium]|nr:hypothetical protein [Acidimicrobiaceae bacterium]